MKRIRYLLSRSGVYWEAVWAFFHPVKILESEVETNRLFTRIRIGSLERRVKDLEQRNVSKS